MLDVSDELKEKLLYNSVGRRLILRFPDDDFEISGENILSESFELTQSIMEKDELVLGGGIVGQMSVKVINVNAELTDKNVQAFLVNDYIDSEELYPSDDLFPSDNIIPGFVFGSTEIQLFTGKIDSAKRQQNRAIREIIAFDWLYETNNNAIYNGFYGFYQYDNKTPALIDFAQAWADIPNYKKDELWMFNKDTKLSFTDKDVVNASSNANITTGSIISAYFELNSAFAYVNSKGELKGAQVWREGAKVEEISKYKSLNFEDYETADITNIRFPYSDKSVFSYGIDADDKSSYVSKNCITKYCSDIGTLVTNFWKTGSNIYNKIFYGAYRYRPFKAELFGYFWLEPGDKVKIATGYEDVPYVESFIHSRTIKGINGMRTIIEAKGKKYFGKEEKTYNG